MRATCIVADLGGTHLRLALADQAGTLGDIERYYLQAQPDADKPDRVWSAVVAHIAAFVEARRSELVPDAPLVMAFPGPIHNHTEVLDAPTVQGAAGRASHFHADLERALGRRVFLLNDIAAAAWHISRIVSVERFFVVTISSGIGSKLFDRSHPAGVIDAPVYAGEIGHLTVDHSPSAPACDCGGRGHLGAIASGRGVERYARRRAVEDPIGFQRSLCVMRFGASSDTLDNSLHLVPAARAGDTWARAVILATARPLADVLLSVAVATGCERIVIVGGFAEALGRVYLDIVQQAIADACSYRVVAPFCNEWLVSGPSDSCLAGAAVFASRLASARATN